MSKRPSHISTAIAMRLPNNVYEVLIRRASKKGIKVSDYTRRLVVYDCLRKR